MTNDHLTDQRHDSCSLLFYIKIKHNLTATPILLLIQANIQRQLKKTNKTKEAEKNIF